jgi:hypothetical protein
VLFINDECQYSSSGKCPKVEQLWALYDAMHDGNDKAKYLNDILWLFSEKN